MVSAQYVCIFYFLICSSVMISVFRCESSTKDIFNYSTSDTSDSSATDISESSTAETSDTSATGTSNSSTTDTSHKLTSTNENDTTSDSDNSTYISTDDHSGSKKDSGSTTEITEITTSTGSEGTITMGTEIIDSNSTDIGGNDTAVPGGPDLQKKGNETRLQAWHYLLIFGGIAVLMLLVIIILVDCFRRRGQPNKGRKSDEELQHERKRQLLPETSLKHTPIYNAPLPGLQSPPKEKSQRELSARENLLSAREAPSTAREPPKKSVREPFMCRKVADSKPREPPKKSSSYRDPRVPTRKQLLSVREAEPRSSRESPKQLSLRKMPKPFGEMPSAREMPKSARDRPKSVREMPEAPKPTPQQQPFIIPQQQTFNVLPPPNVFVSILSPKRPPPPKHARDELSDDSTSGTSTASPTSTRGSTASFSSRGLRNEGSPKKAKLKYLFVPSKLPKIPQ